MFTSLFTLFTALTVPTSTFFVGFGTGLIFSSLGLSLLFRLFSVPTVDAVVQAQPSTEDVAVSTPSLTYSDASIGTLPPAYSEISISNETSADDLPMPSEIVVRTDPSGSETAVVVFDNPEMVDEAFMYIYGELTDLPDVPFSAHTYVNTGTDAQAPATVSVGVNTVPATFLDQGTDAAVIVLQDAGINTSAPSYSDAAVGPDALLCTGETGGAVVLPMPANLALPLVEEEYVQSLDQILDLNRNLITLPSETGLTPVIDQFNMQSLATLQVEVLPGDGYADLASLVG